MPHSRDRRATVVPLPIGAALYRWRSAPEPTGGGARPLAFGPEAPGSIPFAAAPVSTSHRVSLPAGDGYSSRSPPVLRDVAAEYGRGPLGCVKPFGTSSREALHLEAVAAHDRGAPDTAGSAGSSPGPLGTAGTRCPASRSRSANAGHPAAQADAGIEVGGCRHRRLAGSERVAERVGFEPTKSFDSALFKSAAINRSATSPVAEDTARCRAVRT